MPRGTYLVAGRSEAFSCAPGPAGWRYVSDALDLACDKAFRPVRFEVRDPADPVARWARGGRSSLDDGTRVLEWVTSADPERARVSPSRALNGESPGFLVALLRSVSPPGAEPVRGDVPALRFDPPAFAGLDARLVVSRLGATSHPAPDRDLLAEQWRVDDLDAGTRVVVHLAGDVVLAAEGGDAHGEGVAIELAELDSPPTGLAQAH